ncbi:hypothetical protein SAMN06297144_1851 [Sphingomonas guangdongensis]|uniref:Uncharacterized protein n=1 Tax=Sphingomonas guangdongensis TaxID=1141890 RepID=A0A285R322_9SPHN|nr:hypothetical protein [Sphingomonas guangdongensis]SOB86742.1 hypothetical protein SAMN06297144_1851 [Sphingomonas guangdongensis]
MKAFPSTEITSDYIDTVASLVTRVAGPPALVTDVRDSDSTADVWINRRAAWLSFTPALLATVIAVRMDCPDDLELIVTTFEQAVTEPTPGELIGPLIGAALAQSFGLLSFKDGRINLHFRDSGAVSVFMTRHELSQRQLQGAE